MSEPNQTWTRQDVCDVLSRLCRGRGEFPLTGGEIEAQLNWRRRFLARDPDAWRALLIRSSSRASGSSARATYRDWGWPTSRFERAWRRGADTIAAGLSAERINVAAVAANRAAGQRLEAQGRIEASPSA